MLTTPESLAAWQAHLTSEFVVDLQSRGMTSRAEYPVENVAYVKLPPDPGVPLKSLGPSPLPSGTAMLVLVRRPELPTLEALGGWRVHLMGTPGQMTAEMLDDLPLPLTTPLDQRL